MTKKWFSMFVLLVAVVVVLGINAYATNKLPEDIRVEQVNTFQRSLAPLGQEQELVVPGASSVRRPLGQASQAGYPWNPVGLAVGYTITDWQSYTTSNGLIGFNPPAAPLPGVQFTWMNDEGTDASQLTRWGWNAWNAGAGALTVPGGKVIVQDVSPTSSESGFYPRMVVGTDGMAMVAGWDFIDGTSPSQIQVIQDQIVMGGFFGGVNNGSVMDDAVRDAGNFYGSSTTASYPTFAVNEFSGSKVLYLSFVEICGTDVSCQNRLGGHSALKVYRRLGYAEANPDAAWQLVFTDSVNYQPGEIVTSTVSTKTAIAWTVQAATHSGGPDIFDMDLFYAITSDGTTWTKVNVTNNQWNQDGFRPWFEVTAMFDSSDKLHLAWLAAPFEANTGVDAGFQSRLFHWSQWNPSNIYQIYNAEGGTPDCYGSWNVMNTGKISLGECGNRLYFVFSAWNHNEITGADDDCNRHVGTLDAANGEMFVCVSKDLQGTSWDFPRNLTNTYTPSCDTLGKGDDSACADERYAALSKFGYSDAELGGAVWPGTDNSVVPAGSAFSNGKYLQLSYMLDYVSGPAWIGTRDGTDVISTCDVRWIRLACVEPVVKARLRHAPDSIWFPAWTKPNTQKDTIIAYNNEGNTGAQIAAISFDEVSSTPPGATNWLGKAATGLSVGSVVAEGGSGNLNLQLNKAGVVSTGPTVLRGRVRVEYTSVGGVPGSLYDTLHIRFTVADTIKFTTWDTLSTACLKLVVASNGNFGDGGSGGNGRVNMDYTNVVPPIECDTIGAPLGARGDGRIYLYDGSPIVIRKVGTADPVASWAIFADGFETANGFKPLAGFAQTVFDGSNANFDAFKTGTFCTIDSLVKVEKTFYAPKAKLDSCKFIVTKTQFFPYTIGTSVTNVILGEAIDWDVPSDTLGVGNVGGVDGSKNLVYMRGYNAPDTVTDCADNATRWAGMALLNQHYKGCAALPMYGSYYLRNDDYVQVSGSFVPSELWDFMKTAGNVAPPYTTPLDLHAVLTFQGGATGITLPANDTLTAWTAYATIHQGTLNDLKAQIDRALKFIQNHKVALGDACIPVGCCTGTTGNVNMAGIVDGGDLALLVAYLTNPPLSKPTLPCPGEANVNAAGIIDGGDLALLVAYLTNPPGSKPNLPNCPA